MPRPPTPADPAHHPLVKLLARALRRHCRVDEGDHLLLAVSGGADSLALCRALHTLAPRRRWDLQLTICHVQHHLRDDAEDDARFVEALAQQLGVPHRHRDIHPGEVTGNTEANARRLRYAALADAAREARADAVVTAHHADDQLETILMRLLRGSSVKGLAGMAWRAKLPHAGHATIPLLRPMLAVDRETILDYLARLNQPYRHDHTNEDTTRWRARLRRDVLPVLRDLRPDAAHRAVTLSQHLRQVAHLLDDQIGQAATAITHDGDMITIDRPTAAALPPPVLNGVLHHIVTQLGADPDRLTTRELNKIAHAIRDGRGGHRSFDLPDEITISITRKSVTARSSKQASS